MLLFFDPTEYRYKEDGNATPRSPMKTLILDFIRLDESHTGEYLASKLIKCLEYFNITNKVCVTLSPCPFTPCF